MSTKYEKCPPSVTKLADEILNTHESHKPLINAKVKVDFVFAIAEKDEETGEPLQVAIKKDGHQCFGVTRKLSLKDRAMGRGDAEICLDYDWWQTASDEEQRSLLDHELHHIQVKIDKRGLVLDDIGRPVLKLRFHDVQIGWFKITAARNPLGVERLQAKALLLDGGQYFWPELNQRLLEAEKKP